MQMGCPKCHPHTLWGHDAKGCSIDACSCSYPQPRDIAAAKADYAFELAAAQEAIVERDRKRWEEERRRGGEERPKTASEEQKKLVERAKLVKLKRRLALRGCSDDRRVPSGQSDLNLDLWHLDRTEAKLYCPECWDKRLRAALELEREFGLGNGDAGAS